MESGARPVIARHSPKLEAFAARTPRFLAPALDSDWHWQCHRRRNIAASTRSSAGTSRRRMESRLHSQSRGFLCRARIPRCSPCRLRCRWGICRSCNGPASRAASPPPLCTLKRNVLVSHCVRLFVLLTLQECLNLICPRLHVFRFVVM